MSASPRVPTSEKARSRRSDAKSSQAARNSRLWSVRSASSSRRQAGSTFRNVYLTKWRSGIAVAQDTCAPGANRTQPVLPGP
jgi:hypothetical protein